MPNPSERPIVGFLIGLSAVLVTLVMTAGEWDIFDFAISITLLAFAWSFVETNGLSAKGTLEITTLVLVFATLSTSAVISALSMLSAFVPVLAQVDATTFNVIRPDTLGSAEIRSSVQVYQRQVVCQGGIFGLAAACWACIVSWKTRRTRAPES